MTDLMQCLYDYTTDTGFTARLSADRDYRQLTALTERLGGVLRQKLSGDSWDTLEKYQDAMAQRQSAELEAMFLSALEMARTLW